MAEILKYTLLLAYDYSDSEEETEDRNSHGEGGENKKDTEKENRHLDVKQPDEIDRLSTPSSFKSIGLDIAWSILDKNRTQPIRIPIPTLSEVDKAVEETDKKARLKPSTKGSGLFAVLPKPKQHLITPTKRPAPQPIKPKPIPKQVKKIKPVTNEKPVESDSEDDENDGGSFFFVPHKEVAIDEAQMREIEKIGVEEPKEKPEEPNVVDIPVSGITEEQAAVAVAEEKSVLELDSEALAKLCGTKDRRGGIQEIVDVDGNALVGDPTEWLTKELSKEQNTRVSSKKNHDHTPMQKRKHQITYLAQQAKAQELELRNQWANNRMTKKQTQAKYGF